MRLSTKPPPALIAACLALLTTLAAPPASALDGEWSGGGGPLFATLPDLEQGAVGLGASVWGRYGLDDEWNLNLGLLYSYHLPAPIGPEGAELDLHIVTPHVGVVYALDIFSIVPYILLDATLYIADEPFFGDADRHLGGGALLGIGFQWRRWPSFSLGAEAAYHAFIQDLTDYPVYLTIGLHAAYHHDIW